MLKKHMYMWEELDREKRAYTATLYNLPIDR